MEYRLSSDAIEGADVMVYGVSLACESRNPAAPINFCFHPLLLSYFLMTYRCG